MTDIFILFFSFNCCPQLGHPCPCLAVWWPPPNLQTRSSLVRQLHREISTTRGSSPSPRLQCPAQPALALCCLWVETLRVPAVFRQLRAVLFQMLSLDLEPSPQCLAPLCQWPQLLIRWEGDLSSPSASQCLGPPQQQHHQKLPVVHLHFQVLQDLDHLVYPHLVDLLPNLTKLLQ